MSTAVLKTALQARLDLLQSLWAQRDTMAIFDELYTGQTQITGAGSEALYCGKAQLLALLDELTAGSRQASLRLDLVSALGDSAAWSWVTWHVQPLQGEVFAMKSLFVWQLTDSGWRIVADMYAEGEIAA